jgi:hypothetical protein
MSLANGAHLLHLEFEAVSAQLVVNRRCLGLIDKLLRLLHQRREVHLILFSKSLAFQENTKFLQFHAGKIFSQLVSSDVGAKFKNVFTVKIRNPFQ